MPFLTFSEFYRIGFVRPGEVPPGASVVEDAALIKDAREFYASNVPKPETVERWGPTPERTVCVKVPITAENR